MCRKKQILFVQYIVSENWIQLFSHMDIHYCSSCPSSYCCVYDSWHNSFSAYTLKSFCPRKIAEGVIDRSTKRDPPTVGQKWTWIGGQLESAMNALAKLDAVKLIT